MIGIEGEHGFSLVDKNGGPGTDREHTMPPAWTGGRASGMPENLTPFRRVRLTGFGPRQCKKNGRNSGRHVPRRHQRSPDFQVQIIFFSYLAKGQYSTYIFTEVTTTAS
jgi:hypothetical protein